MDIADFLIGSQNLMGTLVSFDYYCAIQRIPLPVAKGQTLKWVGISEEGVSVQTIHSLG